MVHTENGGRKSLADAFATLQSCTQDVALSRVIVTYLFVCMAAVMLSNELKGIMRDHDSPIMVDTVDDDVYHLIISLHKINPNSPLAEVTFSLALTPIVCMGLFIPVALSLS